MIFTTRGIVLQSVKYGDTSIIVHILTELFGMQTYLANGVRTSGKTGKAHFFQPSSILEMQVYHNELKNLQRIKEMRWSVLYKNVLTDVIKNAVAMYMVELLQRTLKQPEPNANLFNFCEDSFLYLDNADNSITGNFPLYFTIQLAPFLGFRIQDNYSALNNIFNLQEGNFSEKVQDTLSIENPQTSFFISQLLKVIHPDDLKEISINRKSRRSILQVMERYYQWHIPEFGALRTVPLLTEILS